MFWNNGTRVWRCNYLEHDVEVSLIPGGSRLRAIVAAGLNGSASWHFKLAGLVAG